MEDLTKSVFVTLTVDEKEMKKPVHYAAKADIRRKKRAITKCSTLKIDFSANFYLAHDFFLAEALSTPQKLEIPKRNLQISI